MNYNVLQLDMQEVMEKYLGYSSSDFVQEGRRTKVKCPFHNDHDPSLIIYDNTEKGGAFVYTCPVCGVKGNNVTLLVKKEIAPDSTKAEEKLRTDFNLMLPLEVRIEPFCDWKGLSLELCTEYGWKNTGVGFEIPYMDETGVVIGKKVRIKYSGKDKYYWDNQYDGKDFHYGWHLLPEYNPTYVVLVEGETDFMTLRRVGIQAIGIPSVDGFLGEKYAEKYAKFSRIIVLKDNDKVGHRLVEAVARFFPNNTFTLRMNNNQKDVNDLFNYGCGRDEEKLKARIDLEALLPATYATAMQYIDGHAERVADDLAILKSCFANAQTPIQREDMTKLIARLTGHKPKVIAEQVSMAMKADHKAIGDSGVTEYDNCYFVFDAKTGEKRISNFILEPVYNAIDGQEVIRIVKFINTDGERSRNISLYPADLASTQAFNTKALGAGNYTYTGSPADLSAVVTHIFEKDVPLIQNPHNIGRMPCGGWLFGNCGVTPDGALVLPDKDGIISLSGNLYHPRGIKNEEGSREGTPIFDHNMTITDDERRELLELMVESYGTYGVLLGLGMMFSSIASNEVVDKHGFFPITFITGKRNSGKTTYATQLYRMFGFEASSGASFSSATKAGMLRTLSYNCSIPKLFDDYRNSRECITKNSILLDSYNRQARTRAGSLFGSAMQMDEINATMLISGEDLPNDSAIQSRCVIINISGNEGRRSLATLNRMNDLFVKCRAHILSMISLMDRPKFLETVSQQAEVIHHEIQDPRHATNMAIAVAGLYTAFGDVIPEDLRRGFEAFVHQKTISDKVSVEEEHSLAVFMNDIGTLIRTKALVEDEDYAVRQVGEKKYLMLRLNVIHPVWVDKYGRSRDVNQYSLKALSSYLSQERFCTGIHRVYRFGGTKQYRYIELCINDMPDIYNDLKEELLNDTEY